MTVDQFEFFPHDRIIGVDTGFTDNIGWNESGIAVDFQFSLDLNKDAILNSLEFKWLAYNTVSGNFFELDSFTFQIAGAIVSGGVQQLIVNATRGYPLITGDQFNEVSLSVGDLTAGIQEYIGVFGQKTTWQAWKPNLGADPIFFDSNELNNNLNDKSSNYSALNNYEIRLAVSANLFGTNDLGQSGLTDYLFLSPTITIYDYDLDGNNPPVFSAVITTEDPITTADLGGSIKFGSDTKMIITYTMSSGPVTSIADVFGIHRIEETQQNGDDIKELSSLTANPPPTNNILIPLAGETRTTVSLVGGLIVTECLIDGSQIQNGVAYSISGEIRSTGASGGGIPADGKITQSGILKSVESGEIKIVN